MKRICISAIIFSLVFAAFSIAANGEGVDYKAGEVLVQFKNTGAGSPIRKYVAGPVSNRTIKNIVASSLVAGAEVKQELDKVQDGLSLVKLPKGKKVAQAMADFAMSSQVAIVQPNYIKYLCAIPDDPYFDRQWGLQNSGAHTGLIDADIDATDAWDIETGDGNSVVAAVLDTGVNYFHPDLNPSSPSEAGAVTISFEQAAYDALAGTSPFGNMWYEWSIALDPNDPNKNSYQPIFGHDFAGADANNAYDADIFPFDYDGHGTHCAGIIGAMGNNGIGISGVCWDVNIMAVKIFDDSGNWAGPPYTTTSSEIQAIHYIIEKKANGVPIKVINASYGGVSYDLAEYNAIQAAGNAGIVFVAAAGNDGTDNEIEHHYPSDYDLANIISVMATDNQDFAADYSNYGQESVDIGAPGGETSSTTYGGIYSTVLGTGYEFYQGTSMAAPHVAGAVALMASYDPNLTPAQIKTILMSPLVCDVLPQLNGLSVSGGRLNLYKAMLAVKSLSEEDRVKNITQDILYDTIQEAIDDADPNDEIIVQNTNYYFEQIDFNGVNVIVRSGDVNNPGDTSDYSEDTIIADIFSSSDATVIFDNNETNVAVLSGFTIADGINSGVLIDGAAPTIRNCVVKNNFTDTDGGGFYIIDSNGAILDNCTIQDNNAVDYGGGIYLENSVVVITDCTIQNNVSDYGAGIYSDITSEPNMTDTTIEQNTAASDGGGMYIAYTAIMHGCIITDNNAIDFGGGIYIDGADPNIDDITISENVAGMDGGGMYVDSDSAPMISDAAITGNSAGWSGGGVYCSGSIGDFDGFMVSNNTARWDGGGIYLDEANPDINDCTFSYNYARFWGGAINYYNVSDANLIDCRFNNNWVEETAGAVYLDSSPINIKNCLFYSNNARTYDAGAIFCWDSSADITNCTFADNTSNTQYGYGGAIAIEGNSDPVILNSIFSGSSRYAIYEFDTTSDPNINYCLFYDNSPADFYDKDTRLAYDANSASVNADMNDLAEVGNILYGDPKFVTGKLGNYYLAVNDPNLQPYTARDGNSPAIDTGNGTSAALGLDTYHTRTDNEDDDGTVDIGYHYNDPDAAADYTLTIEVLPVAAQDPTVTTDPNATAADGITRKQYAEVVLTVTPKTGYVLTAWNGTDNDSIENQGYNNTTQKYVNIATMTANKTVTLTFSTAEIELHFVLHDTSENAELTPNTSRRRYTALRGTKVPLYAEPDNPAHVIIWYNTDDDDLITRENTKTLLDPDGDGLEVVEVEIYDAQTYYVNADMQGPQIQLLINSANDRDIIEIAPGTYYIDGGSAWGDDMSFYSRLRVNGKAITIKSEDPDDPTIAANTVIRGGFEIWDVGRNMRIEGLTIRGNYFYPNGADCSVCAYGPDGCDGGSGRGGGIRLWDSSPTIKKVHFDGCSMTGGNGGSAASCQCGDGGWGGWARGGAVAIDVNSRPLFENCRFNNCYVTPGNGGAGCPGPCVGYGGSWGNENASWWSQGPYEPYYYYSGFGGAIFCDTGSTPEFVDCNFVGNRAYGSQSGVGGAGPSSNYRLPRFGGAVFMSTDSKPTFTRCYFEDNIADNNSPSASSSNTTPYISYGGAIAMEDGATPLFVDCNFVENGADIGGAVYWDFSDPCLDTSDFEQNVALIGGAVVGNEGAGIITRCNFRLNEATGLNARGGAVGLFGANTAIRDSQFMYNESSGSGGAIFVGNKDVDGVDFTGVRQVQIHNNLIVSNRSARDGGGIAAADHAEPNIINCTIANNYVTGQDQSISFGGGVSAYEGAYVRIINSIIWFNTAEYGRQLGVKSWIDRRSTAKVNYSNIQSGAAGVYVSSYSKLDWDYTTNFDGIAPYDSPLFVEGYYLSQDPCQTDTSPCVDAGSGTAFDLGFYRHTTNTNGAVDGYGDVNDFVDLGYHYIVDKTLDSDFDYDGDVDIMDYLLMTVNHWLGGDCAYPDWCNEVDLNLDGNVNMLDQAIFSAMFGTDDPNYANEANDITPPTPDPMTWLVAPDANGTDEITMTATIAADNSGLPVDYLFQMFDANGVELAGADANSGWISENEFTQDGLLSNMVYRFAVKARDAKGNETDWSAIGAATTESDGSSSADRNPPQPNPMTWQIEPYVIEPNAPGSISMTATNAFDQEGSDVEYNFVCTSHSGQTSGWQASRVYTLDSVNAGTYSFYVIARDTSVNHNQTTASSTVSVTITGAVVELVVPSITGRASGSGFSIYHLLTILNPDTTGLVEYRFVCITNSGLSSGWTTNSSYNKLVGTTSGLLWKVQARLVNDPTQIVESAAILVKL